MSNTLVVSFHGGSNGHNNLHGYPGDTKILSTGSADPSLAKAELRAFTLGVPGDASLYVVNGYKDSSKVLQYTPKDDGTYHDGRVWAKDHLHHPFDAVWGPDGNLYVSNQDSTSDGHIRVTVYQGGGKDCGKYLGDFAEGFTTLRGIAWIGTTLWVADENGGNSKTGAVIAFKYVPGSVQGLATGASIAVVDPVHLLYDGSRYLYIGSGSGNCVWAYDTQNPASALMSIVSSTECVPIEGTAGIAIATDDSGTQWLYVCNRKGNAINRYQLDSSSSPPKVLSSAVFQSELGDNPEFAGFIGTGEFNP